MRGEDQKSKSLTDNKPTDEEGYLYHYNCLSVCIMGNNS